MNIKLLSMAELTEIAKTFSIHREQALHELARRETQTGRAVMRNRHFRLSPLSYAIYDNPSF